MPYGRYTERKDNDENNEDEIHEICRRRYVEGVAFNGRAVNANWLSAAELRKGGKLVFKMSDKPVKTRGTEASAAPYSMSREVHK